MKKKKPPPTNQKHTSMHHADSSTLQRAVRYRQDDHKTAHHQRPGDERDDGNAAPARGELAADHPILALEVSVEADEEHNDGDAEECGAERLAEAAEAIAALDLQEELVGGYDLVVGEEAGGEVMGGNAWVFGGEEVICGKG